MDKDTVKEDHLIVATITRITSTRIADREVEAGIATNMDDPSITRNLPMSIRGARITIGEGDEVVGAVHVLGHLDIMAGDAGIEMMSQEVRVIMDNKMRGSNNSRGWNSRSGKANSQVGCLARYQVHFTLLEAQKANEP